MRSMDAHSQLIDLLLCCGLLALDLGVVVIAHSLGDMRLSAIRGSETAATVHIERAFLEIGVQAPEVLMTLHRRLIRPYHVSFDRAVSLSASAPSEMNRSCLTWRVAPPRSDAPPPGAAPQDFLRLKYEHARLDRPGRWLCLWRLQRLSRCS